MRVLQRETGMRWPTASIAPAASCKDAFEAVSCPSVPKTRLILSKYAQSSNSPQVPTAAITNRSKKRADKEVNANQLDGSGNSQASRRGTDGSLVKSSTFKSSHVKTIEGGYIDDPFVRDIISYDEASNGK